jgi:hypothetical protein
MEELERQAISFQTTYQVTTNMSQVFLQHLIRIQTIQKFYTLRIPHIHNCQHEASRCIMFSPEGGVGLVSKRGSCLRWHITHSPDDMSLDSDGGMILTG